MVNTKFPLKFFYFDGSTRLQKLFLYCVKKTYLINQLRLKINFSDLRTRYLIVMEIIVESNQLSTKISSPTDLKGTIAHRKTSTKSFGSFAWLFQVKSKTSILL